MKTLTRFTLVLAVVVSSLSLADEVVVSEGSGMHRSGFLLDRSEHTRPMLLDIHAVLPYAYGFGYGGFPIGVGATFYIPLVKDGFIPPVNDEFGIDFGADVVFFLGSSYPIAFWVPVSVLWTFHITNTFAAYAKAGIALRIWPGYFNAVWPDFTTAVGINWMFSTNMGLRAEVGYPGIKVGLLIAF